MRPRRPDRWGPRLADNIPFRKVQSTTKIENSLRGKRRKAQHNSRTHGLIVYFAIYRLTLSLSLPSTSPSFTKGPLTPLIFAAVRHVRAITSPIRPIACASDEIIEMAPVSCKTSSAATVSARIRESANAISSGMDLSRWWQTWLSVGSLFGSRAGRLGSWELFERAHHQHL